MKEMISSTFFMTAYEKFYNEMRNYLWDIPTLELLADVQMSAYKAFVDTEELIQSLERLYRAIKPIALEDEYLQEAYDEFKKCVEDNKESNAYFTLYRVEEV